MGEEVLVAKRKAQDSGAGFWEFPGGKVEEGETLQEALVREIKEELDLEIEVQDLLGSLEVYTPTQKLIHLSLFATSVHNKQFVLNDHDEAQWISWKDLNRFSFLEGNTKFHPAIENWFLSRHSKK